MKCLHPRLKYSAYSGLAGEGAGAASGVKTVTSWNAAPKEAVPLGLPKSVRERVGKFLLFFGSGKSGHSIVGSLLDAHKHVIVSHEYHLFRKWNHIEGKTEEQWVENLYNELYWKSRNDSEGIRQLKIKGYSLRVDGLWQGRYESYVSVVGDKSGGSTRQEYMRDKKLFKDRINSLSRMLQIPVCFIHVVRNPYDHVASRVLYAHVGNISAVSAFKKKLGDKKFTNDRLVLSATNELLSFYSAEAELIELFKSKSVLEIHVADLINNPKKTLRGITTFLDVSVTDRYLQVCAAKVYRSSSRARDYVRWPVKAKILIESAIDKHQFLRRYNFSSD